MTTPAESYAAIDLGSNSFHMIVTGVQGDSFQVIDKIKDTVRLAAGLDEKNYLSEEASQRAIDCLQKFGQRIKDIPRRNIRAVGTNTLRQAKNSSEFMKQARKALGHPIEIISGREEARLIFLGVAHGNHNEEEQRLIVDIGGGSTEVAIGRGYHAHLVESLYMGCVNMSDRFFKNGEVTAKKMRKAILYALQEMEFIETTYRRNGWEAVYGASGTIRAIYDITAGDIADNYITPEGLNGLKEQLISAGNIDNFTSPALSANRAPVLAGGVAILCAVFESLYIERMYISDSALREGLILDLVGRQHDRDIREKTVEELIARYN
ncbi:MAG TPA: exopolyphosphatase, partial [Gammaproteobacteria bacterium]|nr:exopolyphosphatase [Gammaproteobacteria bacterium]